MPSSEEPEIKGLRSLDLPIEIDTSSSDPLKVFFVPSLRQAIRYDVGVGFFTAGWFRLAAAGIAGLVANGGTSRWIISHLMEHEDWCALLKGDQAKSDPVIRSYLQKAIRDLERELEEETRIAIAWMIADGILDFRIAVTTNELQGGDWHPKFGVIEDPHGNKVAFAGSYNLTVHANVNWEELSIYRSWVDADLLRLKAKEEKFLRVWHREDPNVKTFPIDEASRQDLIRPTQSHPRPYPAPAGSGTPVAPPDGHPVIEDRRYQSTALEKWAEHGHRAILSMATGAGKTVVALLALTAEAKKREKLFSVIAVPYKHLGEQWAEKCKQFGAPVVQCSSDYPNWPEQLADLRFSFAAGSQKSGAAIVTYPTFASARFQDAVKRFRLTKFLIGDEVHHMGATSSRIDLSGFELRLGLSATPERTYDAEGTQWLLSNVGPIAYRFTLQEAIPRFLCPYDYFVHIAPFSPAEYDDYREVMEQLRLTFGRVGGLEEEDPEANQKLGPLLRRRNELIGGARSKLQLVSEMLARQIHERGPDSLLRTLFYASSSLFEDLQQELSSRQGLRVSRFTFEETRDDRASILDHFSEGRIHAILAKRCLDEGVDIPATRTAYILASSSNPMEFVQRRGRVLRRAPGKEKATIHDFFVVPPEGAPVDRVDQTLAQRELKRALEFAETASNAAECRTTLLPIQQRFGLLAL